MEKKKFKNVAEQFIDFQRQNAYHALKQSIYNYLFIFGNGENVPISINNVVCDIVEEFYKVNE